MLFLGFRIVVAAVAAILVLAPPADARTLDEIIKSGVIRVGVHPNGPPLSQFVPPGEWKGFDIDIGLKLAELLGVKAEWVPQETPQRVPNLVADRTDISLNALTRNPDRMKVIDYTVPLHTESMAVLFTDKTPVPLKNWRDANSEKLTVVNCRGCWPADWANKSLPKTQKLLVDGAADMVRALAQGRASIIVENLDFFMDFTKQYKDVQWKVLPDIIETAYCGIGVRKGNDTLRHWLNAALFQIQSEDFHNKAWEKHFGSPQVVPVKPQPYW